MKPVIKSLLDTIRMAKESTDEEKYFNFFEDLLSKVTDVSDLVYAESGELNLFQEVAKSGLANYVKYLLDKFPEIDPNARGKETVPAIFLAINNSHGNVLQVLIDHRLEQHGYNKTKSVAFDSIDSVAGRNIFHALPFHRSDIKSIMTAEKLFSIKNLAIKSELLKVINIRDVEGHTALDYAILSSTQSYMKMLVEFGASLAHHGPEDVITKIPPEMVEHVLNKNCLTMVPLEKSMHGTKIYQQLEDGVSISANFDFLLPTSKSMGGENGTKSLRMMKEKFGSPIATEDVYEDIYPETDTIACLANSSKHQYLLKHPVLVLFLMIKWKHLNFAYTANLLFYLTFVAFITAYIYFVYEHGMSLNCDNGVQQYDPLPNKLWYIVTVLLSMLIMREGYQMSFSFTKYIIAVVNWLEIVLISLSAIMLFHNPNECNLEKKRIAALGKAAMQV